VTYVLDRGLVRFGKFAGSLLAIFILIGAVLYGNDLKKATDQLQNVQAESKKAEGAISETKNKIDETKNSIVSIKNNIDETKGSIDKVLLEINGAKKKVLELSKMAEGHAGDAQKHAGDAARYLERIQGQSVTAETLVAGIVKTVRVPRRLDPSQVNRLIESRLLISMRDVLSDEQYGKLKDKLRANVDWMLKRAIYDAEHAISLPGKLVRSEGQSASNDPVVNQVYDNISVFHQFLRSAYDRNSLDDSGMEIKAAVHYETNFNNSFWDGQQVVFGDGDGIIFATNGFTSLSSVAHELALAVVQYSTNVEFHGQSGAIAYHLADVFAGLTEQWQRNQPVDQATWLILSGALGPGINGQAIRSMKSPGTAYDDPKLGGKDPQPNHMRGYQKSADTPEGDYGGVHINSGIPNRAFYEVAKGIGGNAWDKAGKIWYESMLRMNSKTTFADFAQTTYAVARELFGDESPERKSVKKGWETVGIEIKN
jgi:hypothetical protein